jgi:cytoskeleton protein RodZ
MTTASVEDQQISLPNFDAPLGLRLRHAREAAGMTVAEVAEKLRLKSVTVDALEREDFDALGAAIYVRGYFNGYARLVGVPVLLVDGVFERRQAEAMPELRSTARGVSHSRYLFDRYAKRAVYVVLTASIVVPVILLATRDQLPRQGATLTPLDAPVAVVDNGSPTTPAMTLPLPAVDADGAQFGPPAAAAGSRSAAENPVVASLTPFYKPEPTQPDVVAPAAEPVAAPIAGDNGLTLHFAGDSWVEVLGRNGERLAYGLVSAGSTRQFDAAQVRKVSLGNAEAVEVRMNGVVTDLAAFRRANVARFTVSSQGTLAPAGG